MRLGAGLAYYGLFALVPLVTISLAVAGALLSRRDLQTTLEDTFQAVFSDEFADASASIVESLNPTSATTSLGIVGAVTLLFGASLLFVAVGDAFAVIWDVPVKSGFRQTLRSKAVSMAVVLGAGLVIVAAFIVHALSSLIQRWAPVDFQLVDAAAALVEFFGWWVLGALVIAALFRYLTGAHVTWAAALIGGAVTFMAINIGNELFSAYFSWFGATSVAGAAGSVMVGLLWLYVIAQIVLVGAELTRAIQSTGSSNDQPVGD
jgi:membrane protein